MKKLARRLGISNAAPVRQAGRRHQLGEAAAPKLAQYLDEPAAPRYDVPTSQRRPGRHPKRHRSFHYGSLRSPAFTGLIVLAGFIAVTPLIVLSVLNSPSASVASDAGPEITASTSPITQAGGAKLAVAPKTEQDKPKQDKVAEAVRASAKADVAVTAVNQNRTSDINPAVYVPAAMESTAPRTPPPGAEPPGGVVSMQVRVPDPGPDTQAGAPVAQRPQPTELAAVEQPQAPAGPATGNQQPEGLEDAGDSAAADSKEAAASEPEQEESLVSEEPEGTSAAADEPQEERAAAEEADTEASEVAITKPRPRPAGLAKKALASSRTASIRTDVRMRSRPSSKGKVIMVVPRGSRVEIIDCKGWCNVAYKGRRGYIYKRYIKGATS